MSAGAFEVGEIAVLRNDPDITPDDVAQFEGEDVEIVGPLTHRPDERGRVWLAYEVKARTGDLLVALPHELRRKQPPKPAREIDTVVSWSDCAWSPNMVPA